MNINWHNVKMITLIVITFVATGLSAISTLVPAPIGLTIGSIGTFLIGLEHMYGGNTSSNTPLG
jgi:hypothetical protein